MMGYSLSMILGRYGLSGMEEDSALKEYQQREAAFTQELGRLLNGSAGASHHLNGLTSP